MNHFSEKNLFRMSCISYPLITLAASINAVFCAVDLAHNALFKLYPKVYQKTFIHFSNITALFMAVAILTPASYPTLQMAATFLKLESSIHLIGYAGVFLFCEEQSVSKSYNIAIATLSTLAICLTKNTGNPLLRVSGLVILTFMAQNRLFPIPPKTEQP